MSSRLVCKHCGRRYTRSKNRMFGRSFCSKRCWWNGQRITVAQVWALDNGVCHLCSKWVPLEEASRDHVTPRFHGGKTTWHNIRLAHKKCNSRRGHRDAKEYIEWWEEQLRLRDGDKHE